MKHGIFLELSEILQLRLLLRQEIRFRMSDIRRNGDFYGWEWKMHQVWTVRQLNHILVHLPYPKHR